MLKRVKRRPIGLVAIVAYKGFVATLLAITSIALLLALKHYENLEAVAASYTLESKYKLIVLLLNKLTNLTPRTLAFSGAGTGVYALVTAIEAVGLWYEKTWAKSLVIALVATSIPFEVYELIRGFTLLKLGVFAANIAMLLYLLRHFRKPKEPKKESF